ncbi:MAG: phage tail tape measure protein [Bacteroidaceae bacterium]|nr:phage tail tape measure protein [Bacteroidaceae bacterium]
MATIKDVAEVLIKLDDKEAKKKMPELEKQAEVLRKKFEECFKNGDQKGIKEAEKGLRKVYREMDALQKRTLDLDSAMKNLSTATPKELKRIMEQLNRELNSGAIERGTKEWDEYCDKLKQVKTELKKVADQQKVVEDAGLSFKDMLDIGGNVSMIAASVIDLKDSIADFMRDNVNSYIELDAEMANVQKFTGLAREGVEELNAEFKKIDTRTSIIELNKLAEEAGRLGKTSKEDILGFVKAADIINVALDDLGEGATLEISKLTSIFGDEKALGTEKSMLAVGSVINELSQNCTAAAPYLANFTKRLAGVGAQADMTIPQIMGFAAVLDSQGQAVEMSATAVSQLITKMFQDPAKIAKAVGLDIQEFTNLVKTDTNAALLTLLERLNSFGSMDVLAPLFKEMGTDGARASAVLASLAGNIDMVREQQEVATQAYNEATSVVKEFTVQNETEEAKLEKKRKKFEEVKVALGEKLLPVMGAFTSTGTFMVKTLNALIDFLIKYRGIIITATAALVAYELAVNKVIIAKKAQLLWTKTVSLATKAATAIKTAYKAVTLGAAVAINTFTGNAKRAAAAQRMLNAAQKANLWGAVAAAIVVVIGLLVTYTKKVKSATSAAEEHAKKMRELTDISQMTADAAKEEINALNRLYDAATSETESKENRLKAAKRLQELYPNYFKNLNAEAIMVGKAKTRYDELTTSIINSARAKAAASLIEQHEGTILQKEQQLQDLMPSYNQKQSAKNKAKDEYDKAYQEYLENREANKATAGFTETQIALGTITAPSLEKLNDANNAFAAVDNEKKALENDIKYLNDAIETLKKKYKEAGGDLEGMVKGILPEGVDGGDDEKKNAVKDWLDRENAVNRTAYATGQIDYEEFLKKKHEILLEYYDKMLQNTSLSETERLGLLADKAEEELEWLKAQQEALEKISAESLESSLADIDKKYNQVKAKETAWCYNIANENYGNEKILHEKLFQANVEYLKEKELLYRSKGYSEEADKIAVERETLINDEKIRKQKEFIALYDKMQKEYQTASSEERMAAELATLDALHKEGIIKEVEYQELRKAIQEKYSSKGQKFSDSGFGDMLSNLYTSWDTLIAGTTDKTLSSMQKIGAVAQSTWAIAGAALEQYSAYSQACCDVEVAEIEAKYEKEIAAAGKNQKKVAQLEEQKEKDIAKVKSKYNKQAMTIEMAQAVAQTAMAAINAYASAAAVPVVGYILGPIAAAMAVAAGALQIATIKKQHQAQQAGYYHGGFTRRSANNREEVGVVHANEFVVNAAMTQDPRYKPLWSLIDYAQRNNAVPSLTPEDVSYSLGTGAVVRATTTSANGNVQNSGELRAVAASIGSSAQAINRLNQRLDEGIESYMVMDGERGFDRRYAEYNKLKNNAKR